MSIDVVHLALSEKAADVLDEVLKDSLEYTEWPAEYNQILTAIISDIKESKLTRKVKSKVKKKKKGQER